MLEQADAIAEQDRNEIDVNFVEQPGFDALLRGRRGGNGDVFITGGSFGLSNGAFDAVGHKRKRRSFPDPFLSGVMGHDETWSKGRIAAPALGKIEHPATCYHRTRRCYRLCKQSGALWRDLERHSPALHLKCFCSSKVPLEKLLHIVLRPGDKSIQ